MTTAVLTPSSVTHTTPGPGPNGEQVVGRNPGSVAVSTSLITDANDNTWIGIEAGPSYPLMVRFGMTTFTLGTGRLKTVSAVLRLGGSTGPRSLGVALYKTPTLPPVVSWSVTLPASVATVIGSGQVAPNLTQAEIDALELQFFFQPPDLATAANLIEVSLSVVYATIPTANVTYPTGTPALGSSSLAATWTHTPGSDGGQQTHYQLKVFTAAQYGAGGFSADTSTAAFDSGVVSSSSNTATATNLANSTTFRAYVRTAQTINGAPHWSAWDFEGFTTSYTPVALTSLTAAANDASGAITVTVARDTAGGNPAWVSLEVERQDPDGVWRPVRGATVATTTNTFATTFTSNSFVVVDYEAPNGQAVTYRARATRATGTVGSWTSSSAVTWSESGTVWLKDVHDPTLNVKVAVQEQPQPTLPIAQGVFPVINARYPTVVSDVRRSRVGTLVVQTSSQLSAWLFEAAIEEVAKLLQFPAAHLWQSKYIALSDVQEMGFDPSIDVGARQWQVGFVQIDRPADETDY